MRLGLHVGYWGLGLTADQQLEIVREAESAGFDSVWAAEAYGSDTASVLAWLAANTERIKLGSAIFQMPARTPAMTAMTAATIDNISGGRMLLGIGSSGPQVAEGWHGQPFAKQLQRTREYVAILRKALARERLEFDGELYTLPIPDGPGKALKLTIAPVQERIPIYIAAIGPKNTQLTGEIADGWLPTFFSPEHVGEFRALLEEGAARNGNGKAIDESFDIAPNVNVAIDDDVDRARDSMRPILALYVGGMGSREKNFYNALVRRYGFEDAAKEVQDLYLDGKKDEAAAALPAELIDRVSLCGPKDGWPSGWRSTATPASGRWCARPWRSSPRSASAWSASWRRSPERGCRERPPRRFLLAAFGDPGHAFPAIALGRALVARGHHVCLQTWDRWQRGRGARGHGLRGGARVRGVAWQPRPDPLRGGGAGGARDRAADSPASTPTWWSPTSSPWRAGWRRRWRSGRGPR